VSKNQFLPPKVRRERKNVTSFVKYLEESFDVVTAGSYRREKETVGDLDLLVPPWKDFEETVEEFRTILSYEPIRSGALKSEGTIPFGDDIDAPFLINLWRVPEVSAWGAMLLFATGPYDLNIMMRAKAKGKNMLLSQYGLFDLGVGDQDGKQLDGDHGQTHSIVEDLADLERDIFHLLDLQYLSPVERENWRDVLLPSRKVDRDVVEILSSDGHTIYHIDMQDGKAIECECKGFSYRRKCRHLVEAEAKARRG